MMLIYIYVYYLLVIWIAVLNLGYPTLNSAVKSELYGIVTVM